jgi:hypothetical protein
LYEADVTRSQRLIYEIAIAFSPKETARRETVGARGKSEERKKNFYVDIIRVWDLVTDHKQVCVHFQSNSIQIE